MIYWFNIKRNWINNFKFVGQSQNYNFVFVARICFYKEEKNGKLEDNVKIVIFLLFRSFLVEEKNKDKLWKPMPRIYITNNP